MSAPLPLILTCLTDPDASAFFNRLRKEHFPPERNYLDAHLTLFHHLPAGEPSILSTIRDLCMQQTAIYLDIQEVVFTGKGVAYRIDSPELRQLHRSLQERWKQWLTPQDRQGLWPHITVQNKVDPSTARLLQKELASSFKPFQAIGSGLQVWEYQGGPWELIETCLFVLNKDFREEKDERYE